MVTVYFLTFCISPAFPIAPFRTMLRPARRPDGCLRSFGSGGGKSGLHGNTVPGNARRGRPQGKCHREQTAGAPQGPPARVKGCGKSAPRSRQLERHGKPHREQDQVGATRGLRPAGAFPSRRPGRSHEAFGNGRPR